MFNIHNIIGKYVLIKYIQMIFIEKIAPSHVKKNKHENISMQTCYIEIKQIVWAL